MLRSRVFLWICLSVAACMTTGCAATNETCNGKSFNQLLGSTELKLLFNDMAREFCTETCKGSPGTACVDGQRVQTVLVTDFVDIQSFVPNSQGLLMGELMRGSLNSTCCYNIVQAEFKKYFSLSDNGLVVLSRKINEIKNDTYSQPEAVVGTYSYFNNKIVIFARRINTSTGAISKMVTRELNYSCLEGLVKYSSQ